MIPIHTHILLAISVALFGIIMNFVFKLGGGEDDSDKITINLSLVSKAKLIISILMLLIISISIWLLSNHVVSHLFHVAAYIFDEVNLLNAVLGSDEQRRSIFTWGFVGDIFSSIWLITICFVTMRMASIAFELSVIR